MQDARNQARRKFRVVIRDHFNQEESDVGNLLEQLDPAEQNEVDIVAAVRKRETLRVPTADRVTTTTQNIYRSSTHFEAPPRCFNYDSDYFAPLVYYADETDFKFIEKFNREHKFLKMSTADLECVFLACEEIVKDTLSEAPSFEQVLLSIGSTGPPILVAEAIFHHWESREKQNGSVIRWRDFPPDHCDLRQEAVRSFREMNRSRKNMKPGDYLRDLFRNLAVINEERKNATELLEQTERKRLANERFVREKMRQVETRMATSTHAHAMLLETPAVQHEPAVPGKLTEDPVASVIPEPPSPAFLHWCMSRKVRPTGSSGPSGSA